MSWSESRSQKMAEMRKKFHELVRNHHELTDKSVRVFSHPEATDEQILEVAKALGRNRNNLVQLRQSLADAYYKLRMSYHGDTILHTKL